MSNETVNDRGSLSNPIGYKMKSLKKRQTEKREQGRGMGGSVKEAEDSRAVNRAENR